MTAVQHNVSMEPSSSLSPQQSQSFLNFDLVGLSSVSILHLWGISKHILDSGEKEYYL